MPMRGLPYFKPVFFCCVFLLAGCGSGGSSSGGVGPLVPTVSPSTRPTATPTGAPMPTPTPSPTPTPQVLTSLRIAPAAGQQFVIASSSASYALVGSWPQQFVVTPLDQNLTPLASPFPAITLSSSSSAVSVTAASTDPTAGTFNLRMKQTAPSPVTITAAAGAVTGNVTVETKQAIWALWNGRIVAFAPGTATPLYTVAQSDSPFDFVFDQAGNIWECIYGAATTTVQSIAPFASGPTAGSVIVTNAMSSRIAFGADANLYVLAPPMLSAYIPFTNVPLSTSFAGLVFSVAFDPAGQLWLGDQFLQSQRVWPSVAALAGAPSFTITPPGAPAVSLRPAFDRSGHAWLPFLGGDPSIGPLQGAVFEYSTASTPPTLLTQMIGTSSGLAAVGGVAVDTHGTVWVANYNSILAFAPGATTPTSTLTIPAPPGFAPRVSAIAIQPAI